MCRRGYGGGKGKVVSERHREKGNEKARSMSQVDKWKTKEGNTHMSMHDKLRHR